MTIIKLVISIIAIIILTTSAHGHESDGFKHMKGSSGSIVKAMFCGNGSAVWWIDNNTDGVIDVCKKVILNHEKLHVKSVEPINNDCTCEED